MVVHVKENTRTIDSKFYSDLYNCPECDKKFLHYVDLDKAYDWTEEYLWCNTCGFISSETECEVYLTKR